MIRQISNDELDNFSSAQKYSQFLQSSSWASFEKKLGHQVWQVGVFDNVSDSKEDLVAAALIIEKKLPFNMSYLYAPRGPIVLDNLHEELKEKYFKIILKSIRDITIQTRKYKEIFFKFEPQFLIDEVVGVSRANKYQPDTTLLLNLNKSIDEILSQMHHKTRYNINLARKKGVVVERVDDVEMGIKYFCNLMSETSKRDNFRSHENDYYKSILETRAGNANLWVAKYNEEVIAANIVMAYGDTVTYTHGASSDKNRNLMAPHLLQFEQIKWAKENGYKIYDFWGIAKNDDKSDSWFGFTRFKKGFGGETKSLPGTFDLVFSPAIYNLYKLYKKVRSIW